MFLKGLEVPPVVTSVHSVAVTAGRGVAAGFPVLTEQVYARACCCQLCVSGLDQFPKRLFCWLRDGGREVADTAPAHMKVPGVWETNMKRLLFRCGVERQGLSQMLWEQRKALSPTGLLGWAWTGRASPCSSDSPVS